MTYRIRRASYYYLSVPDEVGEASKVLASFAERGINMLAFAALPVGPQRTQLTVFPEDPAQLTDEARQASLNLDGPHPAILVQGDDELGALAEVHQRLAGAGVNVFASSGVTDGKGSFGYVVYIRPDTMERALEALDVQPG